MALRLTDRPTQVMNRAIVSVLRGARDTVRVCEAKVTVALELYAQPDMIGIGPFSPQTPSRATITTCGPMRSNDDREGERK